MDNMLCGAVGRASKTLSSRSTGNPGLSGFGRFNSSALYPNVMAQLSQILEAYWELFYTFPHSN